MKLATFYATTGVIDQQDGQTKRTPVLDTSDHERGGHGNGGGLGKGVFPNLRFNTRQERRRLPPRGSMGWLIFFKQREIMCTTTDEECGFDTEELDFWKNSRESMVGVR